MRLTWIGHSCFRLENGTYTVIFDPYGDGTVPGLGDIQEEADLVLCSHEHSDHNAKEKITQIMGGISPYKVTEIQTFHDDQKGTLRRNNTIYMLDDGTYKIAHFGDIGCDLTREQAAILSNLDAAMIPVGGFYTIDARTAKKMTDIIQPKLVIPMHYRGKNFGFDVLDTVDAFLDLCETAVRREGCSVTIEEQSENQVVVLHPQNCF